MKDIIKEAIETRRCIHKRPEEGWTEFETTYLVWEKLRHLGFDVKVGLDIIEPTAVMGRNLDLVNKAIERAKQSGVPESFIEATSGFTGAVGTLDTGIAGPVTAMRFDMDCVLVDESKDSRHIPAACGFRSEFDGLMHSCGHDAHTALGLAVARWISENKNSLNGKFILIFQPAEEGTRGAAPIAAKGIVDNVDYFFAGHVGMFCPGGVIGICSAGFLATTKIDLHFTGIPSHAGAAPEKGKSALSAACAAAMMIQGIPRHSQGDTRISVGRLVAGEGRNVTPVHAFIQLETRGASEEINRFLVDNVKSIAGGVAQAYGVNFQFQKAGEATTLVTTEKAVQLLTECAEQTVGASNVKHFTEIGGSEDATILFRRAVEHGAQAAFFMWGCNHHGHHKADFDMQDTENLPISIAFCTNVLKKTNSL